MKNETGYRPGHPWYYKLGGVVHKPKAILAAVKDREYQGYKRDDIHQADNRQEPERSSTLRSLRLSALNDLQADLRTYREFARALHDYRKMDKAEQGAQPICSDIHMSMSLKYNHLYNDFAHLNFIDELLTRQLDLFG